MKKEKIIAGIAVLALAGTCGVALVGCNSGSASTVQSYTIEIDGKDYADWKLDNEQPLDMGSGHRLWGIDTWATGTKLAQDDDGNPVGAYYRYTLDIDSHCPAPEFVSYTLTFSAHVPSSDAYKEPSTLVYSFQGYAYEIDGGYQLLVPNYAEGSMSSECISETLGNTMGDGTATADADVNYVKLEGANGGDLYYCYTNSIIQSMGIEYNVPFQKDYPLLEGMSACKVYVSDSSITKFENDNIYATAPVLVIPEAAPSTTPDDEKTPTDDWTSEATIEDDTIVYGFDPGWATDENKLGSVRSETSFALTAGAFNTFEMAGEPMGWNNVRVTFTFKTDGTVDIVMENNQGNTDSYTGTYVTYTMMESNQYIIQLDDIASKANPDGSTSAGTVWNEVAEEDAGKPGAQVGMNIFYWISKDGKIVLSKMPDADSYSFNVNQGGGERDDGGQPPMGGGEHDDGGQPPMGGGAH